MYCYIIHTLAVFCTFYEIYVFMQAVNCDRASIHRNSTIEKELYKMTLLEEIIVFKF